MLALPLMIVYDVLLVLAMLVVDSVVMMCALYRRGRGIIIKSIQWVYIALYFLL